MLKTLPTYVLLLFLPFCLVAQKARFEFFATADGLAGNNTSSVAQDDQGFIWLVNDGKLHRFPPVRLSIFLKKTACRPTNLTASRISKPAMAGWYLAGCEGSIHFSRKP